LKLERLGGQQDRLKEDVLMEFKIMTPEAMNLLGNSMAEHKFQARVTCHTWHKSQINKEYDVFNNMMHLTICYGVASRIEETTLRAFAGICGLCGLSAWANRLACPNPR
jgi:hypothetical protein